MSLLITTVVVKPLTPSNIPILLDVLLIISTGLTLYRTFKGTDKKEQAEQEARITKGQADLSNQVEEFKTDIRQDISDTRSDILDVHSDVKELTERLDAHIDRTVPRHFHDIESDNADQSGDANGQKK